MNSLVRAWRLWCMAELSSTRRFAAVSVCHLQEWSLWQWDEQSVWRDRVFSPPSVCQTVHLTAREKTPEDAAHRYGETSSRREFNHSPRPSSPDNSVLHNAGHESLNQFIQIIIRIRIKYVKIYLITLMSPSFLVKISYTWRHFAIKLASSAIFCAGRCLILIHDNCWRFQFDGERPPCITYILTRKDGDINLIR